MRKSDNMDEIPGYLRELTDLQIRNAKRLQNAFKKGTSYKSVPTDGDFAQAVSVDFTVRGKGNVLAFFYGHTHSEQVLNRNGIPYISTWNDCPKKPLSNPEAPARTSGTTSEICLNIVTVDLEQNKIFMTKIGAGDDLEISVT